MGVHCHILEYSRAPVVDGVLVGVKILGTTSRNGRTYPQSILRDAMPLYEGQQVYMLHPTAREKKRGSRQLDDHFGTLMDVREIEGKPGLFADLHTKQSHPMAGLIMENAEGSTFGLSHNAVVEFGEDGTTITKIVRVNSVDLVDQPATNHNLFEDKEDMELKVMQEALAAERKATDERMDAFEAKILVVLEALKPAEKKEPPTIPIRRITALENVGEGEGEPTPIGKSHEDFLNCARGFSNTNTKGA